MCSNPYPKTMTFIECAIKTNEPTHFTQKIHSNTKDELGIHFDFRTGMSIKIMSPTHY